MSQVHEDPNEQVVDDSLEALSFQANEPQESAEPAILNHNAILSRHLLSFDNCAKVREESVDWDTSLKTAEDSQGSVDKNAGMRSSPQSCSEHSTTFMSLPIEIRNMIMESIFGSRRVHVRFEETLSSQIEHLRSNVSRSE